jgi:hypothetical protein
MKQSALAPSPTSNASTKPSPTHTKDSSTSGPWSSVTFLILTFLRGRASPLQFSHRVGMYRNPRVTAPGGCLYLKGDGRSQTAPPDKLSLTCTSYVGHDHAGQYTSVTRIEGQFALAEYIRRKDEENRGRTRQNDDSPQQFTHR